MENFELSSIEEAIKDFKEGKFVIVVDDDDRGAPSRARSPRTAMGAVGAGGSY